MSGPKLSFSLTSKPKAGPAPASKPSVGSAPSLKRSSALAFGDDDAHDEQDAAPTAKSSGSRTSVNKQLMAQSVAAVSKKTKAQMEEAKKIDEKVFLYDEVYDGMKEAERIAKEKKEDDDREKKPKYIASLLESAETRRLDHLRAEEKMYQREREAEGDLYADRESFVTQAYKDQIVEMRKAEEEEKQREAAQKAKNGSTGMAHYYRQLLERDSVVHDAAVSATERKPGPTMPTDAVNLTISRPPELEPLSDVQLARAAAIQGHDVELNDSGEIVDKRELLAPGLNLSAPNTRRLGLSSTRNRPKTEGEEPAAHRAVGAAASLKEIRQRQARELEKQMEEEERRAREERERREREETERRVLKRNTETDVMSAKERYLARKKARLEQQMEEDQAKVEAS